MRTTLRSITSFPKAQAEGTNSATNAHFIGTVTIKGMHNSLRQVFMIRTMSLRSRMTLTCHVRFCSRALGATLTLKKQPASSGVGVAERHDHNLILTVM